MLPVRAELDSLLGAASFIWAAGIEDTVIPQPWPGTGRVLDEYALTGHDRRWAEDFAGLARLGVRALRYGLPWSRLEPEPGRWEWDWAEQRIERMQELGIAPIIDLVHYGLPAWLEGAWLAPALPQRLADLAARVAARLGSRARWYTPINEPRITAWYCGRLGWWPPNRRGWRGYVAVLAAVCRASCAMTAALRTVDARLVDVHVVAADAYRAEDPALAAEAARRQQLAFLPLDLITGRVGGAHPLHGWLLAQGLGDAELDWFAAHAVAEPACIGLNLYPLFSRKVLVRQDGRPRLRMRYGDGTLVEDLALAYWRRYRRPLLITETASSGSHARRLAWLLESVAAVRRLRAAGVPVLGYTWWPLFALVAWAYRQGTGATAAYLRQMGLWDLDAGLERRQTPVAAAFAALIADPAAAVGDLNREPAHVP